MSLIHTIRQKLDASTNTELALNVYQANATNIDFAIYMGSKVADISDLTSINVKVRPSRQSSKILADKTSATFDNSLTDSTWRDGSKQHARLFFTNAELNLTIPNDHCSSTFWVVVTAMLTGGNERTLATGYLTMSKDNNNAADPPPTNPGTAITVEQANGLYASKADTDAHKSNKSNPHEVTKAQIGLANVDNTSDINKPVSAAQQAAIAAAVSVGNASDFKKVIYEGDSITAGTPQPGPQGQTNYAQHAPTWATQIQNLTAFDSNTSHHITAVSGSQIATMQARYATQVATHKPASGEVKKVMLIGMIGINDVAAGALTEANLNTWYASLEAYWTQAKADGFYIVWIAPLMGTGNQLVLRSLRKKILDSSIPDQVIDANSFFQNATSNQFFESDRLHLTALGGKRFAEQVNAYLTTGQSSITRSTYRHNGNTFFEENDNAFLPNGEFRATYLIRQSNGDYSQKASALSGVASGSGSISIGSYNGDYVRTAPSGKDIVMATAPANQIQSVSLRIRANGDICSPKTRTYANDAAADADATLLSGSFYQITGSRVVHRKP